LLLKNGKLFIFNRFGVDGCSDWARGIKFAVTFCNGTDSPRVVIIGAAC